MLISAICDCCGDTLHGFIEELEDGSCYHVVICPTCYLIYSVVRVPSKQVVAGQQVDSIESTS
jgi:hypothetical protein